MSQLISIFLVSLISMSVIAGGDVTKGQAKSAVCLACHGANGNSVVATFPKIAGQGESYLLKQLQDFKSGARKDSTMAGIVAGLSADDMVNLAAYFSQQTIAQGVASKQANIALGERLYRGGNKDRGIAACVACHGPKGKGIPSAGFPALASQHSTYTAKQLKDFRQVSINTQIEGNAPERNNDDRQMMVEFTQSLNNAEIKALSEYISGLH
jgi:cytochrome c553